MIKKNFFAAALALVSIAAHAEVATYVMDPKHTFVTFEIGHEATSTNRGRFDKKEGTVEFDRSAKVGKVNMSLDLASVNTGTEVLDKILRGSEVFDTEKYPKAVFVSDRFAFNGDKVSEVTGQLTLKGQTHPITLKATNFNCYMNAYLKREVCGGDFRAAMKRSDWGLNYAINLGFVDDMALVIQVEAIKQ